MNLGEATRKLAAVAMRAGGQPGAGAADVTEAVIQACEAMLDADVAANKVT